MAILKKIAVKTAKRNLMQECNSANVTRTSGIANDFRGKPGKRQVTLLDLEGWSSACEELGKPLDWTIRRANLLISGLNFENSTSNMIIIGSVVLEVTQETDPCKRMEEAEKGLFSALKPHWRGGVCCRVIEEGEILVGDKVLMKTREEYFG